MSKIRFANHVSGKKSMKMCTQLHFSKSFLYLNKTWCLYFSHNILTTKMWSEIHICYHTGISEILPCWLFSILAWLKQHYWGEFIRFHIVSLRDTMAKDLPEDAKYILLSTKSEVVLCRVVSIIFSCSVISCCIGSYLLIIYKSRYNALYLIWSVLQFCFASCCIIYCCVTPKHTFWSYALNSGSLCYFQNRACGEYSRRPFSPLGWQTPPPSLSWL